MPVYLTSDKNLLKHSLILLGAVFLIFLWVRSSLIKYPTQIIAFLLALFIIKHILRKKLTTRQESFYDSVILVSLCLVIVSASGGLNSPVFFLIYFLLFSLSLLLEATIPLVLSFGLVAYFLYLYPLDSFKDLLQLLSFPLITPLAVYFGREHKKTVYQQHDINHLKESIRRETEDVLLWLTTVFYQNTGRLKKDLENIPNISNSLKQYINAAIATANRLEKLGKKLKQAIEED